MVRFDVALSRSLHQFKAIALDVASEWRMVGTTLNRNARGGIPLLAGQSRATNPALGDASL